MVRKIAFIGIYCLISAGCVTKKKALEVHTAEVEVQDQTNSRQDGVSTASTEKLYEGFSALDFAEAMKEWKIAYNGTAGDDFRFWMNQTEKGFEAGAEGKGTANAEGYDHTTLTRLEDRWQERFDSLAVAYEKKVLGIEIRAKEFAKEKSIEKKSVGLQAGAYVAGTIILIFIILLLWLGRKFNVVLKEVRAVLNRV